MQLFSSLKRSALFYPTLLEIMARNNDTKYKGMGFSAFNPNRAKLRDNYEQHQQEATMVSNLMMRSNWFKGVSSK